MNQEALRRIKPAELREHVREELDKQRDLLGVLDRALEFAAAAYVTGRAPDELPDAPALDADPRDWIDYFVKQGTLVYHDQLPHPRMADK